MRTQFGRTIGIGAAMALLAGCGGPKQVSVDHAWVRLSAIPANPAAAYFTIHGGPKNATLVGVTTDVAVKAEMHETMKQHEGRAEHDDDGAGRLGALPAGATVAFKPGGRHVMFFDVNPGVKPGGSMTLTFTLASGERILETAAVVGAGDPAPE